MESLIKHLVEKHNLSPHEAMDAIQMVAEYLKEKNPNLKTLIEQAIATGSGNPADE